MFNKMTSILLILTILGIPDALASKVQQQGIVTAADCTTRGIANSVCLPLTDQIYDSTNGQQLSASISGGLLGGGGGGAAIELLSNTGFESGLSGYTASGGTTTTVTSGSNLIAGAKSASWTATASGQTFSSAAMVIKGLAGGQCSAQLYYLYAGTANDYKFQVLDGSANVLAVTNLAAQSLANTPVILTFPCGAATTGTLTWQVKSNVSSPSALIMDTLHLGSLTVQQASQAQLFGTAKWVNGTNVWTVPSVTTSYQVFPANVSIPAPTVTGQVTAPGTRIPGVVLANAPAGTYQIFATGYFQHAASTETNFAFYDGTGYGGENHAYNGSSTNTIGSVIGTFSYSSPQTNLTFQLATRTNSAGGTSQIGLGVLADESVLITVLYFPSTTTSTVSVGQQPQSWSGSQNQNCQFTTTSTGSPADYNTAASSSCALTEATNNNFGTVTMYGGTGTSAKPGIVFTPKTAGVFLVCTNFLSNSSNINTNYYNRMVDGNNTFIAEAVNLAVTSNAYFPLAMCGIVNVPSVAATTVKLQAQMTSGTGTIYTSGAAFNAVNWSILNLSSSLSAAQFNGPGQVVNGSTTAERQDRAYFGGSGSSASPTACTGSPCTIYSQSGSWLTSVTRIGTGNYTLNIASGEFSDVPTCYYGPLAKTSFQFCNINNVTPSSSTITFQCRNGAGSANDDAVFVQCFGPH